MNAWVRHQKTGVLPPLVAKSPNIGQRGSASTLDEQKAVVRVHHVVGFVREDWGEGNWTAKDLR